MKGMKKHDLEPVFLQVLHVLSAWGGLKLKSFPELNSAICCSVLAKSFLNTEYSFRDSEPENFLSISNTVNGKTFFIPKNIRKFAKVELPYKRSEGAK